LDEYGATAGLVTLRDIMDRLAGEVRDQAELTRPAVEWAPDGSALVDGLMLLTDVETELGIELENDDYDTLGGLVFGRLGRRPHLGDQVDINGHTFIVEELDGLRVSRARIRKREEAQIAATEAVGS
jgi:CBS domain containing-hemolysin-like protein